MQRFSWPAEELLAPQKGFCTVELFTEGSRPSVILDTSLVWSDPTRPLYSFPYRYIHFHTAIPIAIPLYSLPYRYTHCHIAILIAIPLYSLPKLWTMFTPNGIWFCPWSNIFTFLFIKPRIYYMITFIAVLQSFLGDYKWLHLLRRPLA